MKLSSTTSSTLTAKKRMIQALIENSKYLDDKNFLKPVKKKKKKQSKQRKRQSKRTRKISISEYNRLLDMTKQKTASQPIRRGQNNETPEWAKLAFVSTIPNTRERR